MGLILCCGFNKMILHLHVNEIAQDLLVILEDIDCFFVRIQIGFQMQYRVLPVSLLE